MTQFRIPIDTLKSYQTKKKIRGTAHPILPITIWNYTELCQFGKHWDHFTLLTRGLVTDDTGIIVGRSFKKFFNLSEGRHEPTDEYTLFDKLDGSLILLFFYGERWIVASRGSFVSEQAKKAEEILTKHDISALDEKSSYVFEIVYPANRIVVNYGDREELVYLATVDTSTGADSFEKDLMMSHGFTAARVIHDHDYRQYGLLDRPNEEGAVVRFSNGSRAKIKFKDYLRLHRIVTGLNERSIWEMYTKNADITVHLSKVPDEFHKWMTDIWTRFRKSEEEISRLLEDRFETSKRFLPDRKAFALSVKTDPRSGLLFAIADGRDVRQRICEEFRPAFSDKREAVSSSIPAPKIIILIGISASGKSTYAREFVETHSNAVIVNRDSLRSLFWSSNDKSYYDHPYLVRRENYVTHAQTELIARALQNGLTVLIDNTNLRMKYIQDFHKTFPHVDIEHKLFEIDSDVASLRDAQRVKSVGIDVIEKQVSELEHLKVCFDFDTRPGANSAKLSQIENLPNAYVFDIDGTLALKTSDRSYYDWTRVGEDSLNEPVAICARNLGQCSKVLICSGRDEICRSETEKWLRSHDISFDELHMRPLMDRRPDSDIKEIMWRDIVKRYRIIAMYDDRQCVIRRARYLGFTVFDVSG